MTEELDQIDDISLKEYLRSIYILAQREYELNSIIDDIHKPPVSVREMKGRKEDVQIYCTVAIILIAIVLFLFTKIVGYAGTFEEGAIITLVFLSVPIAFTTYRTVKAIKSISEFKKGSTTNKFWAAEADNRERELKDIRSDTVSLLSTAYARINIHPKYRNLVAISSIYEYIDTGRCDKLEGIDGAYNLYETEMRTNMIITQLDIIIDKLEEIRISQQYLYNAFQDVNYNIRLISLSVNNIEKSSAVTAYTAKVIEHNQFYEKKFSNTVFSGYRKDSL